MQKLVHRRYTGTVSPRCVSECAAEGQSSLRTTSHNTGSAVHAVPLKCCLPQLSTASLAVVVDSRHHCLLLLSWIHCCMLLLAQSDKTLTHQFIYYCGQKPECPLKILNEPSLSTIRYEPWEMGSSRWTGCR